MPPAQFSRVIFAAQNRRETAILYNLAVQSLQKLKVIVILTLLFMAAASLTHGLVNLTKKPRPASTFLFSSKDRFRDFLNEYEWAKISPYQAPSAHRAHFPLLKLALHQSGKLVTEDTGLFLLLALLSGGMIFYAAKALENQPPGWKLAGIFTLGVFNYPVMFAFDRAHLEIVVFFTTAAAIACVARQKWNGGAFLLTLAGAMHPYPLIFTLLFAKRRKFGLTAAILAGVLAMWTVSYAALPGGFTRNFRDHRTSMAAYQRGYVTGGAGIICRHSLFGVIRIITHGVNPRYIQTHAKQASRWYLAAAAIIFSLAMYFFFARAALAWQELTMLVCCMTLLPYSSADYRLLYFFIPLFYFINDGTPRRFDAEICSLFSLILIPKNWGSQLIGPLATPIFIGALLVAACLSAGNTGHSVSARARV